MFRAIGFLIILWGLSSFFNSFYAFDDALVAIFQAVEIGADETRRHIESEGFEIIKID